MLFVCFVFDCRMRKENAERTKVCQLMRQGGVKYNPNLILYGLERTNHRLARRINCKGFQVSKRTVSGHCTFYEFQLWYEVKTERFHMGWRCCSVDRAMAGFTRDGQDFLIKRRSKSSCKGFYWLLIGFGKRWGLSTVTALWPPVMRLKIQHLTETLETHQVISIELKSDWPVWLWRTRALLSFQNEQYVMTIGPHHRSLAY